ncbi:DUF1963 domain-containing protein [Steroidobacter flavus]|uniref:DUF1963 domain-containing protein n=1 Tax=Steroidobacter flavus TaxID=1842136 RepID=A0ABV8SPU8_9GAMM
MTDLLKQQAFEAVDRKLRPVSIAEIGGFRPPAEPRTSWFGGKFVLPPAESWPVSKNGLMIPLLQVAVEELPYKPPQFEGIAMVQVFVDAKELPLNLPAKNGEGWQLIVRTDSSGLEPRATPPEAALLRPFPIRWSRAENDAPSWDEAWDDRQHEKFMRRPSAGDAYSRKYQSHPFTKIGGWPAWIQSAVEPGGKHFVLQIASAEKPRWMVGDNGNLYVFEVEGEWLLQWDCY